MAADSNNFGITKLTKDRIPNLPFLLLKEKVLGKRYDLSLVFAPGKLAQKLNLAHRKKEYIPNVLSFPLSKNEGEVVICLPQARREYRARGESFDYFVALLFIHAMLHLKGYRHGSTMEGEEQKLLSAFNIKNTF